MRRTPVALFVGSLLGGCMMGPDYKRPDLVLPPTLNARAPAASAAAPAASAAKAEAAGSDRATSSDRALAAMPPMATGGAELLDTAWWSGFGDPHLDALIATALAENKDLKAAAHRIDQFAAYLQISKSAGLPQAGYTASRTRDTLSENRQVPLVVGAEPVSNNYEFSFVASWELDLWGKLRRADEAAYANLVASEEARRAMAVSLVSELTAGYIRLLSLDRELSLLRQTIASLRESLKLAEDRFAGGGSGEQPVVHAQILLQDRQSEVPEKQAQITQLENKLSALMGRNPGRIERAGTLADLAVPRVPAGLPADVLVQRPDVRRAEQKLIAANAKIGVAKAQYLPTIALTGSTGQASTELSTLMLLTSNFGSFGVALLGPLFTAGRIEGQVRDAEAGRELAAVEFAASVQTALNEVEDALAAHARARELAILRAAQVTTLREQRAVALRRFDGGYSGYFEVLEAERGLIAGLQLLNQGRREELTTLIAVYKSTGGGWGLPDVVASRSTPQKTTE